LFAQSDDEFPGPIAQGSVVGSGVKNLKESLAEVEVVSESVTEDPKGTGRIAEVLSDPSGRASFDEVSTEGLVLALLDGFGSGKELGGLPFC
jgi:hypothetical protein